MPQKKKKYNARFPPGRIKKIMQTDEDVGKVAAAVPIMISRTLELFVESLLAKTMEITNERQARTLSPSHMKQCIMSESRFDFLRDLVTDIQNWSDDCPSQGGDGERDPPPPPPPTVASNGTPHKNNNNNNNNNNHPPAAAVPPPIDRPRRNYQRPVSYDETSTASCDLPRPLHIADESPTSILKRKLLDPSRKAASLETSSSSTSSGSATAATSSTRNQHSKLVRLDSSPAAFSESRKSVTRRRKSNEAGKQAESSLLMPTTATATPATTVNLGADTLGTAMVQIIADEHSSGCKVAVDFSKLISPVQAPPASVDTAALNGVNKLLLNSTAMEAKSAALATPNLTTPTGLNYAPPFPLLANPSVTAAFPAPPISSSSSLQMDEDYDDL